MPVTNNYKQVFAQLDTPARPIARRRLAIRPITLGILALGLAACTGNGGADFSGLNDLFGQGGASSSRPGSQTQVLTQPSIPRAPLPSPLQPNSQQITQPGGSGITFQPQFLPADPLQPIQTAPVAPIGQQQVTPTFPQGQIVDQFNPQIGQQGFPQSQFPTGTVNNGQPFFQGGSIQPSLPTGAAPQGDRVALLLPLSGAGGLGTAARSMRNAAVLAQSELGGGLQVSFYDTQGTSTGASTAARKALSEGAGLILGPLLGSSIDAVAAVANGAGVNVVSFSNDSTRARPGAFLLGVTPQGAIQRILGYAAQQGKVRIAVAVPDNALGSAALAAAQRAAASNGQQIIRTERYSAQQGSDGKKEPAQRLAEDPSFDALLIADNPSRSREFAALLTFNQFDFATKQILGTERWANGAVQGEAGLANAWYAAPASGELARFNTTYQSRFGSAPPSVAQVTYDAVRMANDLKRTGGFAIGNLTKPSGFLGTSGNFRFSANGASQRQYEVRAVSGAILSPAQSFSGFSF